MCGSQLDAAAGPTTPPANNDPFERFFRPRGEHDTTSGQGDVLSAAEIEELGSTHVAVNAMQGGVAGQLTSGAERTQPGPALPPGTPRPPEHGLDLVFGQEGVTTTQSMPAIDAETTSFIPMQPHPAGPPPAGPWGYDQGARPRRSPWFWVAVIAVPALVIAVLGWVLSARGATPAAATLPPASSAPAPSPSAAASTEPSPTASPDQGADNVLRTGSQGALVKQVQDRLNTLGFFDGASDGQFGNDTAQAVISFQAQAGVVGDPSGVVGTHTLEALTAAGSTPTLGDGDHAKAKDVRRLQGALALALGTPVSRSGRYDQATVAAVRMYQQSRQLDEDTPGVVDDQTWESLQRGA
jgi:peptidoglycan hydrolase-like protein with peptidoglycan-binding domain